MISSTIKNEPIADRFLFIMLYPNPYTIFCAPQFQIRLYSPLMDEQKIQAARALISAADDIVIVAHQNPDGDAIGSSLGLYFYLKSLRKKRLTVMMPNDFPDFLKWIPGVDDIQIFESNSEQHTETLKNADLIFTLDFNTLSRVSKMESALRGALGDFIMIDHHQAPDDYAKVTFSDVKMSSTSELVYHFIRNIDASFQFEKEIATCLYTGIMTDTGSFRYATTSAETHRVVANLLDAGASNSYIHEHVFDTSSPDRLRLLGVALENLQVLPEFRTAFITLSQDELDRNHFRKGDTEGFVNYALSVKDVIFAAIFIENRQDHLVKISFRSKGTFSVNDFARMNFNGGGHINAAGGRSFKTLNETVEDFKTLVKEHKDSLNAN